MEPYIVQISLAVLAAVGSVSMLLIKVIWQGHRELQQADIDQNAKLQAAVGEQNAKLAQLHVLVAGDYVKKSEYERMYEMLEKIYAKLDTKADK